MLTYLRNLFIALDQLVNASCGGNPEVTISARTGYLANESLTKFKFWWIFFECVIDFAFKPFDGPGHCVKAYQKENDVIHEIGSDIFRAIFGLVIVFSCVIIAVVNRIWVLVLPSSGYQNA